MVYIGKSQEKYDEQSLADRNNGNKKKQGVKQALSLH